MTIHAELGTRFAAVLEADATPNGAAIVLGHSRGERPVRAYRFGPGRRGAPRVSLLAGCHADEPVGPRLLRQLVAYLATLDASDPLIAEVEWWVVPHINPDGESRNRPWQTAVHPFFIASRPVMSCPRVGEHIGAT